ncbi:MAG: LytTR family DNA-binding domain-containing protein [Bacteroidia bacterium]
MADYHCIIVDDEPLALDVIEKHLSRFPSFVIKGRYEDPVEAFSILKTQKPDLLFLDIEMPGFSGLELIAYMNEKPEVILTTAYREYAVEGFELNVLDYLVKPIPFSRFAQAIDRFLEKKQRVSPSVQEDSEAIFVRADRKTMRIELRDILYIEGVKDYVKIVLHDRKILTKESIGNFMSRLPQPQFVRIHKSFIVARDKITAYTAHDIEIGKIEIPIGRIYKHVFRSGN